MSENYRIFYLIINLFSTFVISKYFSIFFNNQKRFKKSVELLLVSTYYFVISFIHLYFNKPPLTMITNIIMFCILTLLYNGTLKKKLLSVIMIYSVLLLVECIAVLIMMLLNETTNSVLGFAVSQIISFMLLGLFQRQQALKEEILIPNLQLISIIVFPLGGLVLFYLITGFASEVTSFICLVILLIFIILIIFIFDEMNLKYKTILMNELNLQQTKLELEMEQREKQIFKEQLEIIEQNQEIIRMLRHDFNGHLMSLSRLYQEGDTENIMQYLSRILEFEQKFNQYIDTGNIAIDYILNFYIDIAHKKGADLNINIKVPCDLELESFDTSVILGNVIKNAVEAIEKVEYKMLDIHMDYDRGILYIEIENTYDNNVIKNGDIFLTTKSNKDNHGLGLKSVIKCIERYNGEIEFDTSIKNKFKVSILLYV